MQGESISQFFRSLIEDYNTHSNGFKKLCGVLEEDGASVQRGTSIEDTFLARTIEYLGTEPDNHPQLYFHVVTLLHPPLLEHFSSLPTELQDTVRSGLLNAVLAQQTSLKCMGALGLLLRELIEIDSGNGGFNEWVEPLGELLKWLASDDASAAEPGVQFFIYLFKETPYNNPNSDFPFHKVAHEVSSVLFQLFTNTAEDSVTLREKILYLLLQTLKTFSIFDGSEDNIVSECFDGTFDLWMSLFSSIMKSSLTSHLGLKKYVLKILVIVYRDMAVYAAKKMKKSNGVQELCNVWEFSYRFLTVYLLEQVWGRKQYDGQVIAERVGQYYYDDDLDSFLPSVQALAHNIIEFISVIVCSPSLNLLVRLSIYHLINVLFHYYTISLEEAHNWDCNYQYFISAPDHQTLRNKILNILNELIEKYQDYAIQGILVIAEKFLMNHQQAHTVTVIKEILESMDAKTLIEGASMELTLRWEDLLKLTELSGCDAKEQLKVEGQEWRNSEVALSILGRFSEDIIVFQSKQSGVFDIQSFIRGLMKQFTLQETSTYTNLLHGQSLYCLTRFTEIISIKYKNLFTDLIVNCSICVSELLPTAVRLAACKIMTIFFRKLQKHKLELSQSQAERIIHNQAIDNIITIELTNETNNFVLEVLIEIVKHLGLDVIKFPLQYTSTYLLDNFHRNITHLSTQKLVFVLFEQFCLSERGFEEVIFAMDEKKGKPIVLGFVEECLMAYVNVVSSHQKQFLKSIDTDLIVMVLKIMNMVVQNCKAEQTDFGRIIVSILPLLVDIIRHNEDVQVHVATTICLKNMVKKQSGLIKEVSHEGKVVDAIHCLLKIPNDKAFEAASVYVGNLTILTFEKLLEKPDQMILEEVVLKVFRSRTPSVIQSLVLIYSKLINGKTDAEKPFEAGEWTNKLTNIIDFLASFSIDNRMGLKILIDKWLLQQSLFRGKYTKISTFMALSKLWLLRDKRVDNLLVIGFNPSHTNINNDVNAPLKILATLIRCLNNQMGSKGEQQGQESDNEEYVLKQEPENNTVQVELQKFKEKDEKKQDQGSTSTGGGLADRQNQQGSTCYMSAMLEFYDDGEECDETTEEDLIYLKDISTHFDLGEYLTDFFLHLNETNSANHSYFRQCLRQLLKDDLKTLQRHIKIAN